MSQERLFKTLTSFGLTPVDSQVYAFLAKRGSHIAKDIAKSTRMNKQQLYRSLANLQSKGLVSSTLEYPARFTATSFDKVLDLLVKAKMEEAQQIQQNKAELLSVWQAIQVPESDSSPKFMVLEGRSVVYSKILQMIQETKKMFYSMLTVQGLARVEQQGLFDGLFNHPFKSSVEFLFLTELSEQNLSSVKTFLKRMRKSDFDLKVRNPDLGFALFPRLAIRDEEEIVFFITRGTESSPTGLDPDDMCLWTDCASLVQAFSGVFQDAWHNSSDIEERISEIEAGKPTPKTYIIRDAESAKKKYIDAIEKAEKDITILTSTTGLAETFRGVAPLREKAEKGVLVKIMAPIARNNFDAALQLSTCCRVKHVTESYLRATIIDGQHLFQFKNPSTDAENRNMLDNFENAFYTNDHDYVERTRKMLDNLWENAISPSAVTIAELNKPPAIPSQEDEFPLAKKDGPYQKLAFGVEAKPAIAAEEAILNKILNAKKIPVKDPMRDPVWYYASAAGAAIRPPASFNLPDMLLVFYHCNKQSSYGAEDWFFVNAWLETPKGGIYVPVAIVSDNKKAIETRKLSFAGTPAAQNCISLRKDELRIQVHGDTLFAGWTVPIPLFPRQYVLPPACLLVEGYGKLGAGTTIMPMPSGARIVSEGNGMEAFVTFFHPASKYAGPGTDGVFIRETILTAYPPMTKTSTS